MQIIALEGIDAAGKETQVKMLAEKLIDMGFKVTTESFPRYQTPIGFLIRKALKNEVQMDDKTLHVLLEADRLCFMNQIADYEVKGYDFLILDRFTLSNLAFGMAKGIDLDWLKELQRFVRKPDLTLVLDITAETSFKRKHTDRDMHELNSGLLNRARAAYQFLGNELSKIEKDDQLIYVIDANGTPEVVHDIIMSYVAMLVPQQKK